MKIIALIVFVIVYLPVQAQQITVTGKVLSGKDQTPLAGVSVQASASRGTVTRNDGSFTVLAAVGTRLHLTMEGYLPTEVQVTQADLGIIAMDATRSIGTSNKMDE